MAVVYYSEELVKSLEEFATQGEGKNPTPELVQIIHNISNTGVTCYPWSFLQPLLKHLLHEVLQRVHAQTLEKRISEYDQEKAQKYKDEDEEFEQRKLKFFQAFQSYEEAPFTLQRLCELALFPERVYSNSLKFLTALEKMVNISSTLRTLTPQEVERINETGHFPDNAVADNNNYNLYNNNINNNNDNNNNNNYVNNINAEGLSAAQQMMNNINNPDAMDVREGDDVAPMEE